MQRWEASRMRSRNKEQRRAHLESVWQTKLVDRGMATVISVVTD